MGLPRNLGSLPPRPQCAARAAASKTTLRRSARHGWSWDGASSSTNVLGNSDRRGAGARAVGAGAAGAGAAEGGEEEDLGGSFAGSLRTRPAAGEEALVSKRSNPFSRAAAIPATLAAAVAVAGSCHAVGSGSSSGAYPTLAVSTVSASCPPPPPSGQRTPAPIAGGRGAVVAACAACAAAVAVAASG